MQKLEIMITRKKAMEAIKKMPEEFSIDDLIDKLLFINKIEIGLEQAKKGETYSSEEAKKMIREWSK